MEPAMVECRGLRKRYRVEGRGWREALAGIDLTIPPGVIFGLLGPNGAGKTTLLKVLLGLLSADAGSCAIWGRPAGTAEVRGRIGYVPEGPFFHRFATPRQVLRLHWRLLAKRGGDRDEAIAAVLHRTGLEGLFDQPLGGFSKGMLQRFAIAQALLGRPDFLVLDEPTSGLDPVATEAMGRLLEGMRADGITVLLCTHLLSQAETICDRVAILHRGRVVLDGAVGDLRGREGAWNLAVSGLPEAQRPEVAAAVAACGGRVEGWRPAGDSLETRFLRSLRASDEKRKEGTK